MNLRDCFLFKLLKLLYENLFYPEQVAILLDQVLILFAIKWRGKQKPVKIGFYGLLILMKIFVRMAKRSNSFYLYQNQSITTIGNFCSPFL